jgi:hypothetical protein
MNGRHWSDYTEHELAAIKRGATIHASRGEHRPAPVVAVVAPDPAYPPEWLPEVAARATVKATQTPAEWMREQPPPSRNGTAPAGSPPAEAYPAEWLSGADLHPPNGGLGGEGFINRRAA